MRARRAGVVAFAGEGGRRVWIMKMLGNNVDV